MKRFFNIRNSRDCFLCRAASASRYAVSCMKISQREAGAPPRTHCPKPGAFACKLRLGHRAVPTRYAATIEEIHRLRPRVLKLLKDALEKPRRGKNLACVRLSEDQGVSAR